MASSCLFRGPHYASFSISLSTLLAITIDKYVAIAHALVYRMQMTKQNRSYQVYMFLYDLTRFMGNIYIGLLFWFNDYNGQRSTRSSSRLQDWFLDI